MTRIPTGRIKTGMKFGLMGPGGTLYCVAKVSKDGHLRARVINGNWPLTINACGTFITDISDETQQVSGFVMDAKLQALEHDYNAACEHIAVQAKRPRILRAIESSALPAVLAFAEFRVRLRAACRAFADSWNRKPLDPFADFDDSIPF